MTQTASPLSVPLQNKEEAEQLASILEKALDRLSHVLNQETELAKAGKMRQAIELQAEKARLTETFLKTGERFRANSNYFRAELPRIFAHVHKLHEKFNDAVVRNMRVLATAKAVSESLIQEIIDAATGHEQPAGYTASGATPAGKPASSPPLKLNRSL